MGYAGSHGPEGARRPDRLPEAGLLGGGGLFGPNVDVADQRAAFGAVDRARGVEAKLLGLAAQAEVLGAGFGARGSALRLSRLRLAAAELGESGEMAFSTASMLLSV